MVLTSVSYRDGDEGWEEGLREVMCICMVCTRCDQISDKEQQKGGRAHFDSQLDGREGAYEVTRHTASMVRSRGEKEISKGHKIGRFIPSEPLPSAGSVS